MTSAGSAPRLELPRRRRRIVLAVVYVALLAVSHVFIAVRGGNGEPQREMQPERPASSTMDLPAMTDVGPLDGQKARVAYIDRAPGAPASPPGVSSPETAPSSPSGDVTPR